MLLDNNCIIHRLLVTVHSYTFPGPPPKITLCFKHTLSFYWSVFKCIRAKFNPKRLHTFFCYTLSFVHLEQRGYKVPSFIFSDGGNTEFKSVFLIIIIFPEQTKFLDLVNSDWLSHENIVCITPPAPFWKRGEKKRQNFILDEIQTHFASFGALWLT